MKYTVTIQEVHYWAGREQGQTCAFQKARTTVSDSPRLAQDCLQSDIQIITGLDIDQVKMYELSKFEDNDAQMAFSFDVGNSTYNIYLHKGEPPCVQEQFISMDELPMKPEVMYG